MNHTKRLEILLSFCHRCQWGGKKYKDRDIVYCTCEEACFGLEPKPTMFKAKDPDMVLREEEQ